MKKLFWLRRTPSPFVNPSLPKFPQVIASLRPLNWKRKKYLTKLLCAKSPKNGDQIHGASATGESQLSEARYLSLFENNLDPIFTVDRRGRFLTANPAASLLLGFSVEELQTMGFADLCVPEYLEATIASFKASLIEQQPGVETAFFTKTGERVEVFITGLKMENEEGTSRIFCIARDITMQKCSEFKRNVSLEFLGLVKASNSTHSLLEMSAALFRARSGCMAVGIRIREDYFEARGFPPGPGANEAPLFSCGPTGCIKRDDTGEPRLDCLCGCVLRDRCDIEGNFTPYGSFWSGDLPKSVMKLSPEQNSLLRGHCSGSGFYSLALIPLGKKGSRLGLLQFGSNQKSHFSQEILQFWEQIAEELSIAVEKFQTEEALRKANDMLERRVREQTEELQMANKALSESEERFRQMTENAREVFWLADAEMGQVFYTSPAYERVWGRTLKELEANPLSWLEAVHPEDREEAERATLSIAKINAAVIWEYRIILPNGSVRWIEDQGSPVRDEAGKVYRIAGVARDITDRKRAEEELMRANNALLILKGCDEALARAASEQELLERICQIVLGIQGMKMAWVGYAEADKTVRPVAHAGDSGGYLQESEFSWSEKARENDPINPIGASIRTHQVAICRDVLDDDRIESWRKARLKHGFASKICLPLVWAQRCLGVLAIYSSASDAFNEQEVDLLTRLAADLTYGIFALRARNERAELQEELLKISDWEKQSIAQELHDGLCQHLVGTAMMGNLLHRKLAARHDPDADHAKQICDLLSMGANEARNLAHGLHPVKPDPEGLMMALTGLAQMVTKLFQITCNFTCEGPVIIKDRTVSCHLFRLAQEAANNAMKHGKSSEVLISLATEKEAIVLKITDNGIGMSLEEPVPSGMGLKIMHYRAAAIGASLEFSRAEATGTMVTCRLPLPKGDGEASAELPLKS